MNENIIMLNEYVQSTDQQTLFGTEEVLHSITTDISALMVELGIYPTTSKARQAGRVGEVPPGWTVFKASKKVTLWIWNPTE